VSPVQGLHPTSVVHARAAVDFEVEDDELEAILMQVRGWRGR
jgi:hypothetical protein